jgi:hypothetical protein
MTPWNAPASYAPYEERSYSSATEDRYVDELRALRDEGSDYEPFPGETMPLTSKIILIACAFLMGLFVGLQI